MKNVECRMQTTGRFYILHPAPCRRPLHHPVSLRPGRACLRNCGTVADQYLSPARQDGYKGPCPGCSLPAPDPDAPDSEKKVFAAFERQLPKGWTVFHSRPIVCRAAGLAPSSSANSTSSSSIPPGEHAGLPEQHLNVAAARARHVLAVLEYAARRDVGRRRGLQAETEAGRCGNVPV